MPLAGKTIMPRQGAELLAPYFGGVGLVKGVATMSGESNFSVGAYHDNGDTIDSGLMQINVPKSSPREMELRSESLDEKYWRPVAEANARAARDLYHHPWTRNGEKGIREWQPWVAYTSGWATFPEWWVWSVVHEAWLPTGHYVHRAIAGVANYHLVIARDRDRGQALFMARNFQQTFKVKGELGISDGIVAWVSTPSRPKTPPADGVGPRPVKNDGH